MAENPVDKYVSLLTDLIISEERDYLIVKMIKKKHKEEDAVKFFRMAIKPPGLGVLFFYSEEAKREAIRKIQTYLQQIGMEVPAPNKTVQKFLDGGKYPGKKKKQKIIGA